MKTAQIIAPSRKLTKTKLKDGVKRLEKLGYHVVYSKDIFEKEGYHAGSVKRRVNEINNAFKDKKVDLVFSGVGGYGCIELLPYLDFSIIKKNSKPLIGCSDITGLLFGLYKKVNIPLIHGPMPCMANDFSKKNKNLVYLDNCIYGKPYSIKLDGELMINKKNFSGIIIGGNLRILISLLGTDYDFNTDNKILFIEDVNERAPAIYNMLLHMELAGKFKKIKALLVGKMINCGDYKPFLKKFFSRLSVPIIYEMDIGHGENMLPIKLDSEIRFDSKNKILSFYP